MKASPTTTKGKIMNFEDLDMDRIVSIEPIKYSFFTDTAIQEYEYLDDSNSVVKIVSAGDKATIQDQNDKILAHHHASAGIVSFSTDTNSDIRAIWYKSNPDLVIHTSHDKCEHEDLVEGYETTPIGSLLEDIEVEVDDDFWNAIINKQFSKLDWSMKRLVVQACQEENLGDKPVIDAVIDYWDEKDSILYYFIDKLGLDVFYELVQGSDYEEPWDDMVRNVFIFLKGLAKQEIDTVAPIPEDF